MLTAYEINSDITFIDIAKNSYYDFSNIGDPNVLVQPDEKVRSIIKELVESDCDIHMKDTILEKIIDILPSKQICKQNEEFHNLTIDADGKVRLCLRIRGHKTLELNDQTIFDDDGNLHESINDFVSEDMFEMCEGCNWPCILFSEFTLHNSDKVGDLLHTNKR
jgi:hypothetical protein